MDPEDMAALQALMVAGRSPAGPPGAATAGPTQASLADALDLYDPQASQAPPGPDPQMLAAGLDSYASAGNGLAAPAPGPAQPPANPYQVDWNYIAGHEGGDLPAAYVVGGDHPHSGVTIGRGFDLAQHTPADLARYGVPDDVINTLRPVLGSPGHPGLQGQAAADYLRQHAAEMRTPPDAVEQMNQGAMNDIQGSVARAFNDANPTMNFEDLPPAAQTAIMDVAYNYGPRGLQQTFAGGAFWRHVTGNDWAGAQADLASAGRRNHRFAEDGGLLGQAVPAPPAAGSN